MGILKDKARNYSQAFNGAGQLADESGRARKADKIRAVLESEKVLPNQNLRLLDIGCAFGLILKRLAPELDYAVGVDFDSASMSGPGDRYAFVCADAERLPFSSGSFDIIICNHVYEHTDNPERMLDEIKRILAPDGVCYFAGPNKYDLIEPHYGLPFLSWLPRPLADGYLRITGRGGLLRRKAIFLPRPEAIARTIRNRGLHRQDHCQPGMLPCHGHSAAGFSQADHRQVRSEIHAVPVSRVCLGAQKPAWRNRE